MELKISISPIKQLTAILAIFSLFSGIKNIQAQSVDIHGFIFSEVYLDTKEAVASREADVLLYPKKPEYDAFGNDLTDDMCFHMVSFNSRINATATGLDAFGAIGKAVVEVDFLGTGEGYVNLVRMRHAFFQLKWDDTEVLMGQYWHPMFNPGVYPQVLGFGAGAPLNTLSRNSQIRLTKAFSPVVLPFLRSETSPALVRMELHPSMPVKVVYQNLIFSFNIKPKVSWPPPPLALNPSNQVKLIHPEMIWMKRWKAGIAICYSNIHLMKSS